ncbi:MAG: asparagine synthase-related protein [Candidatus Krumholzibacteriia bacterium]
MPDDPVLRLQTPQLQAAVVHHGHWPSSGASAADGEAFLLSGACWSGADSEALADHACARETYLARRDAGNPDPLRGMFALARASAERRQLTVETDRFGTVPVYYRPDHRGGLLVASEIKFLTEPGRDRPDPLGMSDLLSISYHVRNATTVAGVTRLPLHHRLEFGPTGLEVARLPHPGYPRDLPLDRDSLTELDRMAARHFQRFAAVTSHMAIALSGGLDSRLLLFSARRAGVDLEGFTAGEEGNVDVALTRRLAEQLDLPLTVQTIDGRTMPDWLVEATWLSEGRVPFNHLHYFQGLFQGTTPRHPQVHGLIGEAVIGGYLENERYRDATPAQRREGCLDFTRHTALNWGDGLGEAVLGTELLQATRAAHEQAAADLQMALGSEGSYADYLDFRFVFRGGLFGVPALAGQVSPWTDIVSPFLDADVYDFGARLRSEDIMDRVVQLRWGLEFMPGFDALPRVKDGLLLPVTTDDPRAYERARETLVARNRRRYILTRLTRGRLNPRHPEGFPHYAQWYRRWPHVRRFIDGILLDERTADRGLWHADGIRTMLGRLRSGRNLWGTVGAVLLCELLCRLLLDGDPAPDPLLLGKAARSAR